MKRIGALFLLVLLLFTACTSEPERDNERHREPKREESFELLDDSGTYSLYYYDYTRNYRFDEFLRQGGAADTAELV